MSKMVLPGEQRDVLRDVDWETYLALAEQTNRPGKLTTYHCGVLEIMSPSRNHEILLPRQGCADAQRGLR